MRLVELKNGAVVTLDRNPVNGMFTALVRNPSGTVHDKISSDCRRIAFEYFRAFKMIARNL